MNQLMPQHFAPLMPVLDAMADGILVVDASGIIVAINKAMRSFYAGGESPFPGYPLADFNEADWVEAKRVLSLGRGTKGTIMLLPSATVFARRRPILQGDNAVGVLCTMQEIDSLNDIAKNLKIYQDLNLLLKGLLEAIPEPTAMLDNRQTVVLGNSAFCRFLGREWESVRGSSIRDLSARLPEFGEVAARCLDSSEAKDAFATCGSQSLLVRATPALTGRNNSCFAVASILNLDTLEALANRANGPQTETAPATRESDFDQAIRDSGIVAHSPAMRREIERAIKVSPTGSSILLQGESGVGKSMLASVIHHFSTRAKGPFISINCGAIPAQLMESELFGYEKGAFTGANPKGKIGLLEAADKGTIFLDEIGELPFAMQVKLLEALDRHACTRVGGTRPIAIDLRVIAATNRDLQKEVQAGRFRKDLFYRLNVIPIHLPPLRERKEDIYALATMMLERHNSKHSEKKRFSRKVIDILLAYDFPGNARELGNIIEWMLVMADGDVLQVEDLPAAMRPPEAMESSCNPAYSLDTYLEGCLDQKKSLKEILGNVEELCLRAAIKKIGSANAAARMLGMHPVTLWRKLNQHGVEHE